MDPYSQTPAHTGARQPGLTGRGKEDILCRFGKLGVQVRAGCLHFEPKLLRADEFLPAPGVFQYFDVAGRVRKIPLAAGSLAFTYCQVPVIYSAVAKPFLTLQLNDGQRRRQEELQLDARTSRAIFERRGVIQSTSCGLSSARTAV
jgi:hypothetical protein